MCAFKETFDMFRTCTEYKSPLSYDEWLALADDHKAAVLYIQFYDQITLAWYKVKSFYADDEDGVSTMLQYLQKNVPLIVSKKSRFSPSYIYRVAFNCLYCICHDIKRDRERFENEISNIAEGSDGSEVNLHDCFQMHSSFSKSAEEVMLLKEFWRVIDSAIRDEAGEYDGEAEAVLNRLLGGEASFTYYNADKSRKEFRPIISRQDDHTSKKDEFYGRKMVNDEKRREVMSKIRDALVQNGFEEYEHIFN